jgi:HSP90 family molecular chaperone
MFQLEAEFEKDIMEIAGVNSELFGMAENDKIETAGILSKMRQAAGLVNLQDLFDGLRESQKILGQKTLKLIQANYTPEKIAMITKQQVTPEFYSKSFAKYDVVVEEGVLTDTQRQAQFLQLTALKATGVQIPDSLIIKNSSLENKKELEDYFAAQQQAQQQTEQMQTQMAMQQQKVVTDSLEAKAQSDQALAAERINKVSMDAAVAKERIQRSEEEKTGALLNFIKALKELETMDLTNTLETIKTLKEIEGKKDEVVKEKTA